MRLFAFRPCRVSFVLCALLAWATSPENASHLATEEPPRPPYVIFIQPQGNVI